MLRLPVILSFLAMILGSTGCRQPTPAAASAPAPEKPKVEADLAYITLSKKAYRALGIQTQPLKVQSVQERITLTGWIMAKPGHEVSVTAPAAGYVRLAKGHTQAPTAGECVEADQVLLVLEPVLTPVEQIQLASLKRGVEGELTKAKTSVQASTIEYDRLRELHAKNLRSLQDVEQAHKALDYAKEDLAAAQDKIKLFVTSSIALKAPRAGVVLALHASPGQYVAAAAPVATIIDMQPLWLRVPIPEFDMPQVDPRQKVAIALRNGKAAVPVCLAHPAGRVAQVDAMRHTADFWYELEPTKDMPAFFKDQMVTVHLPIGPIEHKQPARVAPYAALVFDAHGSTWVYLDRTKADDTQHRFVRQRVQLGAPIENGLVVQAELADGERMVTTGAAALFSREFHKTPVGEDDDD